MRQYIPDGRKQYRAVQWNRALVTAGLFLLQVDLASGQDRFPDPITPGDLKVSIEDFATVPDSTAGNPPRLNLLTRDPLGRLLVNDQRGPLYTIDSTGATVTEYLDLRDFSELELLSTSEAGFQSFAFHPDFANEGSDGAGRFYTIHSSGANSTTPDFDPGGNNVFHTLLLEWRTASPGDATFTPADPDAPFREVMRLQQPFGNHNAGLIAFNTTAGSQDSDYGNLYVAIGDGGDGGDPQDNGQNTSNPYGAILRIDPLGGDSDNGKYGIVADNAFASDSDANTLAEVFAYGFRNPQRFGWDSATGNMFIADIGQNAVEEIDLGVNGGNFGWDRREGSFGASGDFIDPVAEYDHTNVVSNPPTSINSRAVTVGETPRGTSIPGLDGVLVLSDFPTGLLFTLDVDSDPLDGGQDGLEELLPLDENNQPVRLLGLVNAARSDRGLSNVVRADTRFGINTPGEVYILNKHDGIVRRLAAPLPGDYNGDGVVDTGDYETWKSSFGSTTVLDADGNGDKVVDAADYTLWRDNLGRSLPDSAGNLDSSPVPEASSVVSLVLLATMFIVAMKCRQRFDFAVAQC